MTEGFEVSLDIPFSFEDGINQGGIINSGNCIEYIPEVDFNSGEGINQGGIINFGNCIEYALGIDFSSQDGVVTPSIINTGESMATEAFSILHDPADDAFEIVLDKLKEFKHSRVVNIT
jgi:hypothetical protein